MLSKGRIMQGMEFLETAEVDVDMDFAIAQHVHWDLAPQRGARVSLENVQIIQGATLYREVGENFQEEEIY